MKNIIIDHQIIKAPHNFTDLPIEIERSNEYISNKFYGIWWHKRDISAAVSFTISGKSSYACISCGYDDWRFLKTFMSRKVVNIKEIYAPTFQALKNNDISRFLCIGKSQYPRYKQ